MGEHELGVRAMSNVTGANLSELFRAEEQALGVASQGMGAHNMASWPLHFNTEQYRLSEIINQVRIWHKRDGVQMAIVDHVALVEVPGTRTEYERISVVTRSLKKLSKELNIPVIAVSQLNRNPTNEKRYPTLADLRGSGSIEQDADICIFIHRIEDDIADIYELGLLKNRQGPAGWIKGAINFVGAQQRFVEIEHRYE
jgi:replicative DNA helicase